MKIQIGTVIWPDGWREGKALLPGTTYTDSSFSGCQFRLPSVGGDLACNITNTTSNRVDIEFVGDGEPSTHTKGLIVLADHDTIVDLLTDVGKFSFPVHDHVFYSDGLPVKLRDICTHRHDYYLLTRGHNDIILKINRNSKDYNFMLEV